MFQFPEFASCCQDNLSSTDWVAPFGNLRINTYLRFPVAYRSLSRPSSPLRAKAFPIRPSLLLLTNSLFTFPAPLLLSVQVLIGIFPMCSLFYCTCQKSLLNTPTTSNKMTAYSCRPGQPSYLNYFYYSFFSMSMNSFVDLLPTRHPKLA